MSTYNIKIIKVRKYSDHDLQLIKNIDQYSLRDGQYVASGQDWLTDYTKPIQLAWYQVELLNAVTSGKYHTVVIPGGRQIGKSVSLSFTLAFCMALLNKGPALWVDPRYNSISIYKQLYFYPILHRLAPWLIGNYKPGFLEDVINDKYIHWRSINQPRKSLEGINARLIIINEPGNCLMGSGGRELYDSILTPMVANYPDAVRILHGTYRSGASKFRELYEMGLEGTEGFYSLKLSTFDSPFITDKHINTKLIPGTLSSDVSREYYGELTEGGGNGVKREDIRYYIPGSVTQFDDMAMGVDLASSLRPEADYSAIVVLGRKDGKIYLLHVEAFKLNSVGISERIVSVANKFNLRNNIYVEDYRGEAWIIDAVKKISTLAVYGCRLSGSKGEKFQNSLLQYEAGNMYHPDKSHLSGVDLDRLIEFESQLLTFDGVDRGDHDDMIDAMSIATHKLDVSQAVVEVFYTNQQPQIPSHTTDIVKNITGINLSTAKPNTCGACKYFDNIDTCELKSKEYNQRVTTLASNISCQSYIKRRNLES